MDATHRVALHSLKVELSKRESLLDEFSAKLDNLRLNVIPELESRIATYESADDALVESLKGKFSDEELSRVVDPVVGFVPEDIGRAIDSLKARLERMSAPVMNEEFTTFKAVGTSALAFANWVIAARAQKEKG